MFLFRVHVICSTVDSETVSVIIMLKSVSGAVKYITAGITKRSVFTGNFARSGEKLPIDTAKNVLNKDADHMAGALRIFQRFKISEI